MAFKLTARNIPESDVMETTIRALECMPQVAMVIRVNSGGTRIASGRFMRFYWLYWRGFVLYEGLYDLMVVLKGGKVVMIELKSRNGRNPSGRLRESQEKVKERLLECSIPAFVVDSYEQAMESVRNAYKTQQDSILGQES